MLSHCIARALLRTYISSRTQLQQLPAQDSSYQLSEAVRAVSRSLPPDVWALSEASLHHLGSFRKRSHVGARQGMYAKSCSQSHKTPNSAQLRRHIASLPFLVCWALNKTTSNLKTAPRNPKPPQTLNPKTPGPNQGASSQVLPSAQTSRMAWHKNPTPDVGRQVI